MSPNTQPKWHLRCRDWPHRHRAACGLLDPRRHTSIPGDVTCAACQRTTQMAQAEIGAPRRGR